MLLVGNMDAGAAGHWVGLHPWESYGVAKQVTSYNAVAGVWLMQWREVEVKSQRICVAWSASGAGTRGMTLTVYKWEEEAAT
jgi:hypothetical protein